MGIKRRKGIAIVESKKGILVVAVNNTYILPGGGAKSWESRKMAAIRELYEETKLKSKKAKYLFRNKGTIHKNHKGKWIQNHSKIFLVQAEGNPKPSHEIKKISYYKKGRNIKLGSDSKRIIDIYLSKYKSKS